MRERILYKIDKITLIIIFILVLFIPLIYGIIQEDKIISGIERRKLAVLPSKPSSFSELIDFPKKFNLYYSDHFGLREELNKKYFKLINKFSDQSSNNDVTFGQDGWMFLGSIRPGYQKHEDPMGDAINMNLFSNNELKEFATSLVTIRDWLKKRDVEYIYVIAPIKHSIYFDKLPKHITKKNKFSATDQIVTYLNKNTDVNVLDLRATLLKERIKHQVYFKSDTHWNHYGANVAQFEILHKIRSIFPKQISPLLMRDDQFNILSTSDGDLARFSNIENLKENDPQPIFNNTCKPVKEQSFIKPTETHTMICNNKTLNTVIFRDSFFDSLQPYISRQFHRSTYIWEKINYDSLVKYVEIEKPDIVIDEVVERSLPYIPSANQFLDAP